MLTPATEDWLLSKGFYSDSGTRPNGPPELSRNLWSKGETETYGDKPAMHIVWSSQDGGVFLEAYDTHGETISVMLLDIPSTEEAISALFKALGNPLPESD